MFEPQFGHIGIIVFKAISTVWSKQILHVGKWFLDTL